MSKKVVDFNFTNESYRYGGAVYIKQEFFNRLWLEGLGIIFVILMTSVVLLANEKLTNSIYVLSIGAWIIFCIVCNIKIKTELFSDLEKKIRAYDEQEMFGKSSLSMEENEGIILKLNNKTRKYSWKLIKDIKILKGNMYIFISSVDYLFIPKEAFIKVSVESVKKQLNQERGPKKIREIINV